MAKKKRGRRGNGEGSIYRRADGRWVGQHTVETPWGVSKRKTIYGKTRAEAAAKLQEAMAQRESEVAEAERKELERCQKTVSAHVEDYLADVARRVRPKAHRRYEDLYHCHVEGTEVGERGRRSYGR